MIKWPTLVFPPINLNSAPAKFTKQYRELEVEYTKDITEQFDAEPQGTTHKEVLRRDVLNKRKEFNRLWNARARG